MIQAFDFADNFVACATSGYNLFCGSCKYSQRRNHP